MISRAGSPRRALNEVGATASRPTPRRTVDDGVAVKLAIKEQELLIEDEISNFPLLTHVNTHAHEWGGHHQERRPGNSA